MLTDQIIERRPESVEGCSLAEFDCGKCVRLSFLCLDPEQAVRLREMGLCEGREIAVLHNTDKLIVKSGGTRIGLHRDLAQRIYGIETDTTSVSKRIIPVFSRLKQYVNAAMRKLVGKPFQEKLVVTEVVELERSAQSRY